MIKRFICQLCMWNEFNIFKTILIYEVMKNKRLLFALSLLLGAIILSCQDEMSGRLGEKEQNAAINVTIEKAKAIFESKSPDFPVIQSRSAEGVEKGIVFEPTWGEAFVSEHKDGTTVETHIRLSHPFHMLPQDSRSAYERTRDGRYLQHLSRAVVLMKDDQSTPHAFLMSIIGSKKYMEEHDFQLWDVSYGNIPKDFSGQILYHALDGTFVNGWYVEEGHKYSTCEPVSEEDANLLSRASITECKTIDSFKYYWICKKTSGKMYETYENEDTVNTVEYCNGPYRENIKFKVCSVIDTTGVSAGTPSSSGGQYVATQDASRLFSSSSISPLRNQLRGFISFMEYKDDASRAVLDYIENTISSMYQKLNVRIDATQAVDVRYSSSDNTVYFKSENHYSDLALYEEVIHAAQRVVYADYYEGPFNIEFEAKLIIDYARLSSGSKGHTDLAANMEYAEVELQNGSFKTMAEWLDDLSYSYFDVNDYWEYMNVWSEISTIYRNYMMGLRMHPKLLVPIIDVINGNW